MARHRLVGQLTPARKAAKERFFGCALDAGRTVGFEVNAPRVSRIAEYKNFLGISPLCYDGK
jgi:hypothetical protein